MVPVSRAQPLSTPGAAHPSRGAFRVQNWSWTCLPNRPIMRCGAPALIGCRNTKMQFKLTPNYTPKSDQAKVIADLAAGIREGERFQTMLGVTGSGKRLPPEQEVWLSDE